MSFRRLVGWLRRSKKTHPSADAYEWTKELVPTSELFVSEGALRSQGALAEVDGQPTYALVHMKDDLAVMHACVDAETENYWRQQDGHRIAPAPFFFERVAILHRKSKNYEAEIAVCELWVALLEDYRSQGFVKRGSGAKVWLGPKSRKIIARLPKARELLKRQSERG